MSDLSPVPDNRAVPTATEIEAGATSPGLTLLRKALQVVRRHHSVVRGWRLWADTEAIHADLRLGHGGARTIRFEHAHDGSAWARTPSFNISLVGKMDTPPPDEEQAALQTLIDLLRRSDPGGLRLPLPSPEVDQKQVDRSAIAPEAEAARRARAEEAHAALADELHWASFLAYKCITTEDLYPHVGPLGDVITTEQLLDGWRSTVDRIREGTAPQKLGLYVHIPFCTVACTFCYCAKTDKFRRQSFDAYVDRLVEEAELFAPVFDGMTFTSVYFGGGTPSLLSPPAMKRVFDTLYRSFHVPTGTQVIYEGNPDSLSERKIEVLAHEGKVTRLTIGVQTLDDEVQRIVRRFNKPHHVADAVQFSRAHGIKHVNTDLMAGLPGQTLDSFKQDLEFLISLQPDSIHLNAFRPLPRVSLAKQGADDMTPERVDLRNQMMAWGFERLRLEGHQSGMGQGNRRTANAANLQEYNLRRQNSSLLGLGFPARAHAFGSWYYVPDTRLGMDPGLAKRIEGDRTWQAVPADDAEERHKYLVENLRTGFERQEFIDLFGMDCLEAAPDAFRKLEWLGVLEIGEERIHSYTPTHADNAMYRALFYSPAFMQRAERGWGAEYDRSVDYRDKLRHLVEDFG